MYVYKRSEPQLWTVGYYDPQGKWQPESDHESSEDAAKRVNYLNGETQITVGETNVFEVLAGMNEIAVRRFISECILCNNTYRGNGFTISGARIATIEEMLKEIYKQKVKA